MEAEWLVVSDGGRITRRIQSGWRKIVWVPDPGDLNCSCTVRIAALRYL